MMRKGMAAALVVMFSLIAGSALSGVSVGRTDSVEVSKDFHRQGFACYQKLDYDNAERLFIKSLAANPMNRLSSIFLALVYQQRGEVSRAIAVHEAYLSHDPKNVMSLEELGKLYLETSDCDNALRILRRIDAEHGSPEMLFDEIYERSFRSSMIGDVVGLFRLMELHKINPRFSLWLDQRFPIALLTKALAFDRAVFWPNIMMFEIMMSEKPLYR